MARPRAVRPLSPNWRAQPGCRPSSALPHYSWENCSPPRPEWSDPRFVSYQSLSWDGPFSSAQPLSPSVWRRRSNRRLLTGGEQRMRNKQARRRQPSYYSVSNLLDLSPLLLSLAFLKERSQTRERDQNPGQTWGLGWRNGAGTLTGSVSRTQPSCL